MTDFAVDTGDLGAMAQVFAAASADASGIAAAFRAGGAHLATGDALGRPEVVAAYGEAFEQWAHNLDEIAGSIDELGRALALARRLYEITERDATVETR
ncbi:MAG TPA: hypothetical protein VMT69_14025 [Kineosporiaceae bacterium]|nr:hypothetical protein [Kineosporiaceae bacterium]